jgi:tripartite-type tricarboxylate transporter receptor subunit TctC
MDKRLRAFCLAISLIVLAPGAAFAQWVPSKTVRVIVPFPGGGINDVLARIVADKLQEKWGQPIVVENKSGAGGNIGADLAAHSEPDGHTLFVAPPPPLAVNQSLYKQLSYKPEDFVPITVLGSVPNLVIVRNDIGVSSVMELIDYIKQNAGKVSYGSQGNGTTPHLTGNMFKNLIGVELTHIPYRGEILVMNDMLGGHVDIFFGNISAALPHYRSGKLKVLAVTDKTRSPMLPEIPTAAEAGLPGLVSTTWFAMVAPPKTPPAIQSAIAEAVVEVVKMPDVQEKFRKVSIEPVGNSPAEMSAFVKEDIERWREVIRKNHISVE